MRRREALVGSFVTGLFTIRNAEYFVRARYLDTLLGSDLEACLDVGATGRITVGLTLIKLLQTETLCAVQLVCRGNAVQVVDRDRVLAVVAR